MNPLAPAPPEESTSYATIDKNGVEIKEDGVCLKVTCHPAGTPRTVRLGSEYAGPGWGLYTLPKDGDELLVAFPRDGGIGCVTRRLNNAIDTVPKAELDAIKDLDPILLIHPQGWKLVATSEEIRLVAGSVPVVVEGSDIKLGDDSAVALCREELHDWVVDMFMPFFRTHIHTDPLSGATGPPEPISLELLLDPSGDLTTKVKGT